MRRDWSNSTVVILTCDRDKKLLDLCLRGIERFWKGIKVAIVHDKNGPFNPDVPDDLRELQQQIPFLAKLLDFPYIAQTDQIYCIDSDCLITGEPWDWPEAAYLSVEPGPYGVQWLKWGSQIWQDLGCGSLDISRIFCGGCWSARTSQMFDPHREVMFDYLRTCHERHSRHEFPGPIYEQCCLNGLWHMVYEDRRLPQYRYPLYHHNPHMAIYHMSDVRDMEVGKRFVAEYEKLLDTERDLL